MTLEDLVGQSLRGGRAHRRHDEARRDPQAGQQAEDAYGVRLRDAARILDRRGSSRRSSPRTTWGERSIRRSARGKSRDRSTWGSATRSPRSSLRRARHAGHVLDARHRPAPRQGHPRDRGDPGRGLRARGAVRGEGGRRDWPRPHGARRPGGAARLRRHSPLHVADERQPRGPRDRGRENQDARPPPEPKDSDDDPREDRATHVRPVRRPLPRRGAPYTCPACGIEGILDVEYDYDVARAVDERARPRDDPRRPPRFDLALHRSAPDHRRGGAARGSKSAARRSSRRRASPSTAGVASVGIKDDGRLPTGSFKDRASAVGTTKARELGFETIACSSTGNAASSLAGFCADAGLEAIIFVPAHAPPAKVAQLRAFGATVLLVEGSYDQAYYLCEDACRVYGWYDRNCAVNPYLVEGKKTCGLEIGEQFARTRPTRVVVALGDGCTTAGIWKGLRRDAPARRPAEAAAHPGGASRGGRAAREGVERRRTTATACGLREGEGARRWPTASRWASRATGARRSAR